MMARLPPPRPAAGSSIEHDLYCFTTLQLALWYPACLNHSLERHTGTHGIEAQHNSQYPPKQLLTRVQRSTALMLSFQLVRLVVFALPGATPRRRCRHPCDSMGSMRAIQVTPPVDVSGCEGNAVLHRQNQTVAVQAWALESVVLSEREQVRA